MATQNRRRIVLVAALIVTWLCVGLVWWSRRTPPLDVGARNVLSAVLDSDGSALMGYAFPEEVAANDLTPEKIERVLDEIVLPRLSSVERLGEINSFNYENQGGADFSVRTKQGLRMNMATDVYPVEGRARTPVLYVVSGAWMFDYFNKHPEPFTILSRNRAVLAGLEQDREKLKAIGIKALTEINIPGGSVSVIPIDSMGEKYRRWIAKLEVEAQPTR